MNLGLLGSEGSVLRLKSFAKNSLLRPWDGPIILGLILCSFIPLAVFGFHRTSSPTQKAELSIDGKEIKTFYLDNQHSPYTYRYHTPDGAVNLIEIDGERIRVKEANCHDRVCIKSDWITHPGETIVCLPHKLVIEIKSSIGGGSSVVY